MKFSDSFECQIGKGGGSTVKLSFVREPPEFWAAKARCSKPAQTFHEASKGGELVVHVAPE